MGATPLLTQSGAVSPQSAFPPAAAGATQNDANGASGIFAACGFSRVMSALLETPPQEPQGFPGSGATPAQAAGQPDGPDPGSAALPLACTNAAYTNVFSDIASEGHVGTASSKDGASPAIPSKPEKKTEPGFVLAPLLAVSSGQGAPQRVMPGAASPSLNLAGAVDAALPRPQLVSPQIANRQIANPKNVAFELQLKTKTPEPPKPAAPEAPLPAGTAAQGPEGALATAQPDCLPQFAPDSQAQGKASQPGPGSAPAKPHGQAEPQEEQREEPAVTTRASAIASGPGPTVPASSEMKTVAPQSIARPADTPPAREPAHAAPVARALGVSDPAATARIPQRGLAQDISVRISRPEAPPVDLHLTQRAGGVHVSVRTMDTGLQVSLRQDLNRLVNSLDRAGYHAEAIAPGDAAQLNSQQGREESQPESQDRRQGGGDPPTEGQEQRRGQSRRHWMELMEDAQ